MDALTQSETWRRLAAQRARMAGFDLRTALADANRCARFTRALHAGEAELLLDFSKNLIDEATFDLLLKLAEERGLRARIDAMFAGERINTTEDRAAFHVGLRDLSVRPLLVDGSDVRAGVEAVRARFLDFAESVRGGQWAGYRGQTITDVVNVGIGGSDLGPQMVVEALRPYHDGPRLHFVSNVDGAHLASTVRNLDAARTLFIVASKTFTTIETMTNARAARRWLVDALGVDAAVARHFVAVSTNARAVTDFGIASTHMFGFWDWVGGRYSLWSAIGLPIAMAVGRARFLELLAGAHALDEHFRTAAFADNLPVILALLGVWYVNFWDAQSHSIAPYNQHLHRLVAHIQQLDMESNGKRVRLDGTPVDHATAPVVWGEPGTNGQHAFFQRLHQGPTFVPVDFLLSAQSHYDDGQHKLLAANFLAQSAALARGRRLDEAASSHREFPGNRPSNTLLVKRLDAFTLGMLIALYEHKVFVQGVIWDINSFDQWGVELGKEMATALAPALDGAAAATDASSAALIEAWRRMRS